MRVVVRGGLQVFCGSSCSAAYGLLYKVHESVTAGVRKSISINMSHLVRVGKKTILAACNDCSGGQRIETLRTFGV